MGNCCIENDIYENNFSYKILTIKEAYYILQNGYIMCRICKDNIYHAYISIIYCNNCRLVIGHEDCYKEYYKNKHEECPLCLVHFA